MRKVCSNCNFSKLIKYKKKGLGYTSSDEALFCTLNPPNNPSPTIHQTSRIISNYAVIQRYFHYPEVNSCAPCHQYQKKSSKEMIKLEKIYKKEKEQKKLEEERERETKRQKRKTKIALLAKIKKEKEETKKKKLRNKKRKEYQKKYREKIKAEKLVTKLEEEKCYRFEIMDL